MSNNRLSRVQHLKEVSACLELARSELGKRTLHSNQLVALRLRLAIEHICYCIADMHFRDKFRGDTRSWHASNLIEIISRSNPEIYGQKTITPENGTTPVIEIRFFDRAWLNKTYIKLGSIMHAPQSNSAFKSFSNFHGFLEETLTEIERVSEHGIVSVKVTDITTIKCECSKPLVVQNFTLTKNIATVCEHCGVTFETREIPNGVEIRKVPAHLTCDVCSYVIPIKVPDKDQGHTFSCEICAAEYASNLFSNSLVIWRLDNRFPVHVASAPETE